MSPSAARTLPDARIIIFAALILALISGGLVMYRSSLLSPTIYSKYAYGDTAVSGPNMVDAIFDSDIPQISRVMTDSQAYYHHRTSRHPWMSVALYPGVKALRAAGVPSITAIRIVTAACAALWTGLLFVLLAVWGLRVGDAVVFTVMANVSAAAMFWLATPENYVLGSATLIAGLLLTLWPARAPAVVRHALAMTLTLSITITNSLSALIAAAQRLSVREIWVAGASAFFVVTIVWGAAAWVFPTSQYFLPLRTGFGAEFSVAPTPGRVAEVANATVLSSMVMPPISVLKASDQWKTTVQGALAFNGGALAVVASVAWLALLGLGLAFGRAERRLWLLAALSFLALFLVYSVLGFETFLFTMHFLPFLIVLSAAATFTRWRRPALALSLVVIVAGGLHNWRSFQHTAAILQELDAWARTFPGASPPAAPEVIPAA